MKKFTSFVLAVLLIASMLVTATASTDLVTKSISKTVTSDYMISEFDIDNLEQIDGEIHGIMGDIDYDDVVSVIDATDIQLYLVNKNDLSDVSVLLSDVDGDTQVTVMDATEIQLFLAKKISSDIINHVLYTPAPEKPSITPEQGARLTVWAPYSAVDIIKKQCNAFVSEYSSLNLRITVEEMGEGDAATNILNDPYSSADVFSVTSDQMDWLYDARVILPVDQSLVDDVSQRNLKNSVDAASLKGELYAYPQTADNGYFLYYNKKYVSDQDAKTIEGILAACRKANKDFIMDASNGYFACMIPFTGGLRIEGYENEDSGVQKFNDYNETEVVNTMSAFSKLVHSYDDVFVNDGSYTVVSGFHNNTVAAGIDGSWDAAGIKSILGSNFGVVKLPTINVNGSNKQMISMHGYKMFAVNSTTYYPNASQLLADYLTNEACQIERAKSGFGPCNINAISSDVVQSNPTLKAVLDQSKYSVAQSHISPTFWDPMGNLGNEVCNPNKRHTTTTLTNLLRTTVNNIKDW